MRFWDRVSEEQASVRRRTLNHRVQSPTQSLWGQRPLFTAVVGGSEVPTPGETFPEMHLDPVVPTDWKAGSKNVTEPRIVDIVRVTQPNYVLASDTKYLTRCFASYTASPAPSGAHMMGRVTESGTITKVTLLTDAGTANVNIEARTTADLAGTDIWSSDVTATSSQTNVTSFTNAGLGANNILYLTISAVTSATKLWVFLHYTIT